MLSFDTKEIEMDSSLNWVMVKKIEIDANLICMIIISSQNKKILTPILNKIVDYVIDNIDYKDTYNKFSVTLESINFFIKNIRKKEENIDDLSIVIWILEKNNFHFSKVWEASCYMIDKSGRFLEISSSKVVDEFDFILTWKLLNNEKIILTNKRVWDYLTQTDMDDIWVLEDIKEVNKHLENIVNDEKIKENIKILSFWYTIWWEESDKKIYIEKTKNLFYTFLDNDFAKKWLALFMLAKEKIEKKWKITKNIVFLWWILLSVFLLYSILSSIVTNTIEWWKNAEYKTYLIESREYLRLANENITNPEAFDLNIKKSEELAMKVKEENLFLNDVNSLIDDISIIKKQFNWVETFETTAWNMIFKWDFSDWIRIVEVDKKIYVIWKSSIYWPIVQWQDIKINVFEQLEIDDEFIDGTVANWEIVLATKKSRIVNFGKDWKFKYVNVLWQTSWQKSSFIESYNSNIYLTNESSNQVFMHSPAQNWYNTWVWYLNDADTKTIWKILSVWIDGWIYILKNDLTLLKFFRSPKYRIESIVLNKLPKNYTLENPKVKIVTKPNLSYVYLLLNNKIWVFEPNTKIFSDTKSLTYLWQIEWKNEQIISFDLDRDNEIEVLTKTWIYKLWFEVKEWKLIVR